MHPAKFLVPANTSSSAYRLPASLRAQGVAMRHQNNRVIVTVPEGATCQDPVVLQATSPQLHISMQVGKDATVHTVVIVPQGAVTSIAQEATVETGGAMHWHTLLLGSEVRHSSISTLAGPRAQASADVLCYAHTKEWQQTSVHNRFRAADGGGTITITGVAEQQAHMQCNGMIDIGLAGRGTDTFLAEEVLMLDPTARVDAIPGLEIRTNDVKASHSATVSRLSSEDLFYFASRGIRETVARQMFVEGFLRHALQRIPGDALQKKLADMIVGKYRSVKRS